MKIIDRKTFMSLPSGTVYAKYAPQYFQEICIKGDSIIGNDGGYIDWFEQTILQVESECSDHQSDILWSAEEEGRSFALDLDYEGRDGLFEDGEKFAVYETQDVKQLIARLGRALVEGYGA